MRADVFIKTWYNDLAFLSYCLRFLEKNWLEPASRINILANTDCDRVIGSWRYDPQRFRFFYVEPWPDGNQFQVYLTFLFDHFSDADLFVVFDSDCMLVEPMQVSDQLLEGKPIIFYEPTEQLQKTDLGRNRMQLWYPVMERWLGQVPPADFMVQFPFLYRAESIRAVRRLITAKSGHGLFEALYSGTPFDPTKFLDHPFLMTEHNVLGFYCWLHEADRYHFALGGSRSPKVQVYHSWTQWNPQTQAELDRMLLVEDVAA